VVEVEGLQDVVAADSSICYIDGDRGILSYRGIDIHELAASSSFEEVCFLLWNGRLPRSPELEALKAQIHPHFLFNSLNSISALVGSDPAKAREMCIGLADFLRQSLSVGERAAIPLSEEIALATSYLDVERARFGRRLSVETDVTPEGGACVVPPLLLQPLVENAVVHGIATLEAGGTVRMQAERTGRRLRIVIENPYDPEAPPKRRGGLGLKIVRDRLSALYGGEALFAARRLDGRHLAILSIPIRADA